MLCLGQEMSHYGKVLMLEHFHVAAENKCNKNYLNKTILMALKLLGKKRKST